MATIQDIINDVKAVEKVIEVSSDFAGPITEFFEKVRIRYVYLKEAGEVNKASVKADGSFFIITTPFDEGNVDKKQLSREADFFEEKPVILKEPDIKRDNLMTKDQVIAAYQNKEKDKSHEVIDVRISQHGEYDIATLRVDTGIDSISRSYTVYQKEGAIEPEMKENK